MATTKIWPIRDGERNSKSKGTIELVIEYVENEDKTDVELTYKLVNSTEAAAAYTDAEMESLNDVMDYAMGDAKTEHKRLVTGINVSIENARDEICTTKKHWHKEDKILLWHGYQSFKPGEVTPEQAHQIGIELAENLWGEHYEVIVATHIDREHIHNHFVINSVSFDTGKKLDAKWQDMRKESDRLCEKYGKSVIKNPMYATKPYSCWKNENKRTWTSAIKDDIDEAVLMSRDIGEFLRNMSNRGYEIKYGAKYFTLRPPGKERFVRIDRRLGAEYELTGIAERINYNLEHGKLLVIKQQNKRTMRCINHPKKPYYRWDGFQSLYLYYCYQLGVIPKKHHVSASKVHYLFREELLRIDLISKETRFLLKNGITNLADLGQYKAGIDLQARQLLAARKHMRNTLRRSPEDKQEQIKVRLKQLNKEISDIRNEQLMCEDIVKNSGDMKERIVNSRILTGGRITKMEKEKEELR